MVRQAHHDNYFSLDTASIFLLQNHLILAMFLYLFLLLNIFSDSKLPVYNADVCVYGGTSAGVIAAYTAAKNNQNTILIEAGLHLGGLSSGGLGATDIGNKAAITGRARAFYKKLGSHYGTEESWTFEPHVAENIFNQYIKESNVKLLKGYRLRAVKKSNKTILYILVENEKGEAVKKITAKVFIDCSYEGDLMAKAGVSYTVGRESNATYNETLNGTQFFADKFWGDIEMGNNYHQFPDGVDPYKIKGNVSSGLLYGIEKGKLPPNGTGDARLQAYNYRLCLTDIAENKINFTAPQNYNADNYELLRRVFEIEVKKKKHLTLDDYLLIIRMPNGKTDVNNRGPMSTDFIGMNKNYPGLSYSERKKVNKEHENYIRGLFYFLANDSGVPDTLRKQMKKFGWAKDEFTDNNHFPHQLYIRESRRMIGEYVMTEHNCRRTQIAEDSIGLAAYNMDSHHCRRLVVNGMVKNEGDVQVWAGPPYPIAYRSITPKREECTNLLVPVCLSASHIAYGSIRMEPVFMVLGESAGGAASIAI